MIRFACPRCRAILERAESAAGSRFPCPSCGQGLEVPHPAQVSSSPGNPEQQAAADIPPPPPMPYVTSRPEPAAAPPKQDPWDSGESSRSDRRSSRSRRDDDSREIDVSRPRRRRRPDYDDDDDYDDDLFARRSGSRFSREVAAKASTSGFICSMGGMLLFVISLILFMVATRQARPMGGHVNPMFFVVTLMTVGSFILGLMGTIFSSRGLDQANDHNRGMAVAGLVVGIIDIVLASIGGIFLLCLGIIFFSAPF